uniref:Uncharacterized protein n=1 Tax=Leptocylindrus danicus TaxID=163516 RepID=A0A7S2LNM7_9STRA|mmetsp:Transcript_8020/g.11934  ORF Transcript_8020/g.11934 Transcript_8020/m.11934 type:complete len:225 (+) Transcript_8020:164-838(+)
MKTASSFKKRVRSSDNLTGAGESNDRKKTVSNALGSSGSNRQVVVSMNPGVFSGKAISFRQSTGCATRVHPSAASTPPKSSTDCSNFKEESKRNENGLKRGFMLLDAQVLKFRHPETYWAPDIDELQALQPNDRVMLCSQDEKKQDTPCRFWVTITDLCRNSKSRPVIEATVDACGLFHMGIKKGTHVWFDFRNIFNVHDDSRDALFDRYVALTASSSTSKTDG